MSLSPSAEKMINNYFNLPFDIAGIRCPYFNNAKLRQRAQLRVLIGKGTPHEIVDEAKIVSLQYKKGLFDKNGHCCLHNHNSEEGHIECIRKFLIDSNLGIDCSGFASHILLKHYWEEKKVDLRKAMFIVTPQNFLRWVISKLRPVEQMSVGAYANDKNSEILTSVKDLKPADLIVMLKTGPRHARNHMLLITENDGIAVKYVHARAWASEGQYGHGVSNGQIKITKPNAGLLEQEWTEKNFTDDKNGTLLEAKQAEILQMRRLKF